MGEQPAPASESKDADEGRRTRLRRYSLVVTGLLILACNGIVALTVWGMGINLNRLVRLPEIFNPANDVCLRFGWHDVKGTAEPVRLCNEWIRLSDPTGESHRLQQETHVVQGADGKLYFDHGARMGYQAFGLFAWVMAVVAAGVVVQRRLIARYRLRLGLAGKTS
jgi:hypothetical protein